MAISWALTNSFAQQMLAAVLDPAGAPLPSMTELWMALHTASPGRNGSYAAEVSGGSYARQDILSKLSAPSANGVSFLTATVTFSAPTALWGNITFVSLGRASTGGQMLWVGELYRPVFVDDGDPAVEFGPAKISLGFR